MIQDDGWMRTYVSCVAKCALPINVQIFPIPKPPKRLLDRYRNYPFTFTMYAHEKRAKACCTRCKQCWDMRRII